MSIDTRNLRGARASSAVRCIAKAEHEALGTSRDDENQAWLEKHFRRGVNVGRAWAAGFKAQHQYPSEVELEAEIPWGLSWVGHADAVDFEHKMVYEVYHAAGGEFREAKALQAALYADSLGPEFGAELQVIDSTNVSDEEGFAVQPYEINVDGLRDRVRDIKDRVVAAVQDGSVNPNDRVGDSPHHSECFSCPFRSHCWDGWQPPQPDEVVGLEDLVEQYRIVDGDLAGASQKKASLERQRDELRDAIRPYTRVGIPLDAGTGITIRRTEVAGRISVKLGDFRKAGYQIPSELEPFVSESKPSERWKVDPA